MEPAARRYRPDHSHGKLSSKASFFQVLHDKTVYSKKSWVVSSANGRYLRISAFLTIPTQLAGMTALQSMAGIKTLVVDVRDNRAVRSSGKAVADRFADRRRLS
jgi:hypothetical protein